jgi:endonuclease-3
MKRAEPPQVDRERAALVFQRLRDVYGPHEWHSHGPPLDELIGTVLSQNTSDVNTARSFRSLRDRFPDWELVRLAPAEDVADAIRSGGLAQIKAPRIKGILDDIAERNGELSLDHLRDVDVPAATAELTALHGVGPKTAACVLLFSLGRPAMPVDTHVHRVSNRIGLVPPRTSAERTQPILESLLGKDRDVVLTAHINLIHHGRQICRAQRPRCGRCPVAPMCDYYRTGIGVPPDDGEDDDV